MIICPSCKEEIDDNSHYCDQCGQALLYCNRCGRVGIGRRCTHCGGLMVTPEQLQEAHSRTAYSAAAASGVSLIDNGTFSTRSTDVPQPARQGIPVLTLYNSSLNINIQGINGAVIGRRQGPYVSQFEQNKYVSGVHAQLKYNMSTGWCVIDKHSSNGTRLNQHPVQPDVEMSLKNGDILTIANINLQVRVD